ncbi:protein TonB [Sphingomonas sp. UYAg733]
MTADLSTMPNRIKGAIAAVVVQVVLGYILITGLAVHAPNRLIDGLTLFRIAPPASPPPPEKIIPNAVKSAKAEGASSPPNLRAKATEIVAPTPIVPLTVPPPVVAAPVAGIGNDPSAGAATVPGPGTGSGGVGNGTGNGRYGEGDGGRDTPPRKRSGRLKYSDNPTLTDTGGVGGMVSVSYAVETNGRVTDCLVTRSSGNRALDETTCRLIEERFRFSPSRDGRGKPLRAIIEEDHEWVIEEPAAAER